MPYFSQNEQKPCRNYVIIIVKLAIMLKCQKQLLLSNIFVRLDQIVQLQIMQGI